MGSHLGFYDLMNIAEQNIEETERKAKGQHFVSYTPSGAKKLNPKQKKLSENVQKFLAKKEQEKKLQMEEARRKRERLLELRSHDKKATKRVGQMLRMTKSANKSVISDAMNCLNDSLAEQGEEQQPDEDDYGYVSKYAEEFHKKMMEKYKAIPASKPVKKNTNVPVPLVQSLKSSKGSNNNSSKESVTGKDHAISGVPDKNQSLKKPKEVKKSVPPPLNFNDLLDLAKQKCLEPVTIKAHKPEQEKKEEKYEFGRPMTAKEKAEYLQERAIRARISVPNFDTKSVPSNDRNNNKQTKASTAKAAPSFKIPNKKLKVSETPLPQTASPAQIPSSTQPSNSVMGPPRAPSGPPKSSVPSNRHPPAPSNVSNSLPIPSVNPSKSKSSGTSNSQSSSVPQPSKSSNSTVMPPPRNIQIKEERKSPPRRPLNSSLPTLSTSKNVPPIQSSREIPKDRGIKRKSDEMDIDRHQRERPISRPIPATKIKQEFDDGSYSVKKSQDRGRGEPGFRPDIKIKSEPKENRPNPRREAQPPPKAKPSGRQIIDSDEEEEDYDSEMDDFIDDSDLNGGNISDIIRQITGYDKRRYEDGSDDECMESSAYEQMREESRSLRIGIQEDLEDMRLEAEEKKTKSSNDEE